MKIKKIKATVTNQMAISKSLLNHKVLGKIEEKQKLYNHFIKVHDKECLN